MLVKGGRQVEVAELRDDNRLSEEGTICFYLARVAFELVSVDVLQPGDIIDLRQFLWLEIE